MLCLLVEIHMKDIVVNVLKDMRKLRLEDVNFLVKENLLVVMIQLWTVLLLNNLYVKKNQHPHIPIVLLVKIQDVHFVLNSQCLMELT